MLEAIEGEATFDASWWVQSEEAGLLQRDLEERILKALFSFGPESAVFQRIVAQFAWMGASENQKVLLGHDISHHLDIKNLDVYSGMFVTQCGFWKRCREVGRFIAAHKFEILTGVALCATGVGIAVASGYALTVSVGGIVVAGANSIFSKDEAKEKIPYNPPPILSKSDQEALNQFSNLHPAQEELPKSLDELFVTTTGIWVNGQFYPNEPLKHSCIYANLLEASRFNSFFYQTLGEKTLSATDYQQAIQNLGKAIQMNPMDPTPYLERGKVCFESGAYEQSLQDYQQFVALSPEPSEPFSTSEFSLGFVRGLHKGVYESGEGLFLFLSDFVKHPINTSKQIIDSVSTLVTLVRQDEWGVIAKALSQELHQLVTEWDSLPSEKRGELAGYAVGKHGTDILLPGALVKVASKSIKAAEELAVVCKNIQFAQETLVLETAAGIGSPSKIAEIIEVGKKTGQLANDLGYSGSELGALKKVGKLEETIANSVEEINKNPPLKASLEVFSKAEKILDPYRKIPMPESEVRTLIQGAGIKTFPRPAGIPENYLVMISERGGGMIYVHPTNNQFSVRVMPGKLHSPNPYQQKPYVNQRVNGKSLDKNGNIVENGFLEAHIPLEEFIYRESK